MVSDGDNAWKTSHMVPFILFMLSIILLNSFKKHDLNTWETKIIYIEGKVAFLFYVFFMGIRSAPGGLRK